MKKARKRLFARQAPDERPPAPDARSSPAAAAGPVDDVGSAPRSVESMLQEFSGGESTLSSVRASGAGRTSAKYDQLWQLSMADPHTGLANQLLLLDRLTQALARRRRHGGEVLVCNVELENLGEINLDLGYTTGNAVLCEMARRLTSILRTEDTVGRVGGSELVTVLAVNDEQDVGPLVRRLQLALDEPVVVGGQGVRLRATLGVAVAEPNETAEDVLVRADRSARVGNR